MTPDCKCVEQGYPEQDCKWHGEVAQIARQACFDIQGRSDDCDMRMHGIIMQAIGAATAKLREDARLFGEIIAVMNGDGGHYQAEHGSAAAYNRAVQLWHERYRALDIADCELIKLREEWEREREKTTE